MKKSILIGSNGYLGRHLANELKIKGFDNKNFDLQDVPAQGIENYSKIDVSKKEDLEQLDSGVDYIFLFAGLTGTADGFDRAEDFIRVNELGLLNLLNWMRENDCKARIVFPSTRLVYQGRKNHALIESDAKETKTIYALNKLASENLLWMYQNAFGINYTAFRICVPYGNNFGDAYSYGTLGFFLSKAINGENITLFGDGSIRRTFTHVDDISRVIVQAIHVPATENEVLNIGGENQSLLEVAEMIAVKFGVGVQLVDWPEMALKLESDDTVFDDEKLRRNADVAYKQNLRKWINSLRVDTNK
jgi:UDP-glucose 4-epimerase